MSRPVSGLSFRFFINW